MRNLYFGIMHASYNISILTYSNNDSTCQQQIRKISREKSFLGKIILGKNHSFAFCLFVGLFVFVLFLFFFKGKILKRFIPTAKNRKFCKMAEFSLADTFRPSDH